jgi:uncharacterized phage-associated protein
MKRDTVKLDSVMATFVNELDEIGVFHFNKLAYLFEYFYIKNFGKRYTKEQFVKFPHGPVLSEYKKVISELSSKHIINVDLTLLDSKRRLDDDLCYEKVLISCTELTSKNAIDNPILLKLIKKISNTYGKLNTKQIEEAVYKTKPVIKIEEKINAGLLRKTGTYILCGNWIRMKDYDTLETRSRRSYCAHIERYPEVKGSLQKELAKELSYLNEMRPKYE